MTQHEKVLQLHKETGWVCGNSYRREFIFSPHKRRDEVATKYRKTFEFRKCRHGSSGVMDYFLRNKRFDGEVNLIEWEYKPVEIKQVSLI